MAVDPDFWKRAYSSQWDRSSRRERELAEKIQENVQCTIDYNGLGAGSSEFIHGTAEENGSEKGDPDLHVRGTNIYVEVTGPLRSNVSSDKPLWVRPDKIDNAERQIGEHETFIAHNCPSENLWRIIHIDEIFAERRHEFAIVHPRIQGRREEYIEIDPHDSCIREIEYLYSFIRLNLDDHDEGDLRGDEGNQNMTPDAFGPLTPAARIIDIFLVDVLGLERAPRRHYMGYCRSRLKMDVTLAFVKEDKLRIRMAKPLNEIRDSRHLCHTRAGNPSQPTEMIISNNAQVVYALVILRQVGNE